MNILYFNYYLGTKTIKALHWLLITKLQATEIPIPPIKTNLFAIVNR